jgi:hypothetical protein
VINANVVDDDDRSTAPPVWGRTDDNSGGG